MLGRLAAAKPWYREMGRPATLCQPCLPQIVIGLNHFAQLVLRGPVALVVVGMEPLNQLLESRLDVGLGGAVLQIELAQALPLGALDRPLGRLSIGFGRGLGEQYEWIVGGKAVGEAARAVAASGLSGFAPRN